MFNACGDQHGQKQTGGGGASSSSAAKRELELEPGSPMTTKRARMDWGPVDTGVNWGELDDGVGQEEEMEGEPERQVPVEGVGEAAGGGGVGVPVEPQVLPPVKYEYLDHTADVQIHAWGDTLAEAFEQCAMGMFAYITDVERVDNLGTERIEASGHDMLSLLFGFLDEWLFLFNAEPYFVARKISITSFDRENFKISATGYGETFDLSKHTQGTEVKAITYSNMQFHEKPGYAEVFVIIDI